MAMPVYSVKGRARSRHTASLHSTIRWKRKRPSVSVPVLSIASVRTAASSSSWREDLTSTPMSHAHHAVRRRSKLRHAQGHRSLAPAGERRDAAGVCDWHGDDEGAGARHNHHCERAVQPGRARAGLAWEGAGEGTCRGGSETASVDTQRTQA